MSGKDQQVWAEQLWIVLLVNCVTVIVEFMLLLFMLQ